MKLSPVLAAFLCFIAVSFAGVLREHGDAKTNSAAGVTDSYHDVSVRNRIPMRNMIHGTLIFADGHTERQDPPEDKPVYTEQGYNQYGGAGQYSQFTPEYGYVNQQYPGYNYPAAPAGNYYTGAPNTDDYLKQQQTGARKENSAKPQRKQNDAPKKQDTQDFAPTLGTQYYGATPQGTQYFEANPQGAQYYGAAPQGATPQDTQSYVGAPQGTQFVGQAQQIPAQVGAQQYVQAPLGFQQYFNNQPAPQPTQTFEKNASTRDRTGSQLITDEEDKEGQTRFSIPHLSRKNLEGLLGYTKQIYLRGGH